jgi:A/G-specific adenine glycosylase
MNETSRSKDRAAALLLSWYKKHQRNLPWRDNKDPYRILVSEIMLQQTRVEAVKEAYKKFMKLFPDACSLAKAEIEEVLKAWEGLGYYRRARYLHRCCQTVCTSHGGDFPVSHEELKKLPGIGDYTAAAISSIAFNQAVPVLDGNVIRIISRLFCYGADPRSSKKIWNQFMELIKQNFFIESDPGDFNQAMMELGALICLPAGPKCKICPVRLFCDSFQRDEVNLYPQLKKREKAKEIFLYLFLGYSSERTLTLTKKTWRGYQENHWMPWWFESGEICSEEEVAKQFFNKWGITKKISFAGKFSHHITNHKIRCYLFTEEKIVVENNLSFAELRTGFLRKSFELLEKLK